MRVVLLLGPSSAGKTTLCDELRTSQQWEVISLDDVVDKIFKDAGETLRIKLNETGLVARLAPYMTEDELFRLCQTGQLNISKGEHLLMGYDVKSPHLPDIELALANAGFEQSEIKTLSETLRAVGKVYIDNKNPNIEEKLLDEAFSDTHEPSKTIIIDTVPGPSPSASEKIIADFNHRAASYRHKHGNESLETFTVLAYLSPEQLSERVQRRNIEADQHNNPKNKRVGLFPFGQLGRLVTAGAPSSAESFAEPTLATTSHQQLLKIAYQHKPFNPDETEIRPAILRFKKAGEAAIQYVRLSKEFGMKGDNSDGQVALTVREGLHFDAMINTSGGDPKLLADQLLHKMDSVQAVRARTLADEQPTEASAESHGRQSELLHLSTEKLLESRETQQRFKAGIRPDETTPVVGGGKDEIDKDDSSITPTLNRNE